MDRAASRIMAKVSKEEADKAEKVEAPATEPEPPRKMVKATGANLLAAFRTLAKRKE